MEMIERRENEQSIRNTTQQIAHEVMAHRRASTSITGMRRRATIK
jgi:hypothetical protein